MYNIRSRERKKKRAGARELDNSGLMRHYTHSRAIKTEQEEEKKNEEIKTIDFFKKEKKKLNKFFFFFPCVCDYR